MLRSPDFWLNLLMYCVIPLLTVVILFFAKRKRLWTAPLISTALAFVVYMTALRLSGMESPISTILGYSEWRVFFLLAMLIQLVIVTALTAFAHLIGKAFPSHTK